MAVTTLSIAQALVYKKRVIQELTKVSSEIAKYNSVEIFENEAFANRDGVDINTLVQRREELKTHLIQLKLVLWDESQSIRPDILKLAELKDDMMFWGTVDTKHGKVKDKYESEPSNFDACIKKQEVEQTKLDIQREIDRIQNQIDKFNYTKDITIDMIAG